MTSLQRCLLQQFAAKKQETSCPSVKELQLWHINTIVFKKSSYVCADRENLQNVFFKNYKIRYICVYIYLWLSE